VNEMSILLTIQRIRNESEILREMEEKGEIVLAGAMYDNETGVVTFLN
jgi:carbonic anhydrase